MGVKTIALLACVLPAGCYHGLGAGPDGDVGVGSDGAASDGAQTAAGSDTGDGDGDDDDACAAAAPDVLRRLTGSQYARSVTALTGIELSAALLGLLAPVEPPLDAFENLADTLLVRQSDAEAYQRIAESVARERFSGDDATIAGWVGCASSEPTCLENFIERFTRLAYRRPGAGMFDNGLAEQYPEQAFTSGGGDVILATDPGFAYDPTVDQMVAWLGGGPYVLDLATKAWTRKSGTDAPVDDLAYGSFGRWRYLCEYNVFILVNSMDDVYFYKHTAGA